MRLRAHFIALFVVFGLARAVHAEPLTLQQCFERAVVESNRIKARAQDIKRSQAVYQQALAELYPEVFAVGLQRIRSSEDFGSLSSGSFNDPSTGIRRSRSLGRTQFEGTITVSQPIFRGFKEFIAADAAKSDERAAELETARERELLLGETAQLYFQILLLKDQQKIISEVEDTLHKRIAELNDFLKLGKSRESEVLSAEGDVALQSLLLTRTEKTLAAAKEVLGSLIGIAAGDIELAPPAPAQIVEPLDALVGKLRERSDIRAKLESERSLELSAKAEGRSLWPAVSLDGTTFPIDDPDRNRDWEVGIQLEVPLFEGGRVDARVQELEAERGRVHYEYLEQLRVAERDLRESLQRYEGSLREIGSAEELREKRRKNYEAQRNDYTLGVVTNLEVLSSLAELQNAELELIQARSSVALERVRLDVIVGGY